MIKINITKFKTHFNRYIAKVKQGKEVVITYRTKPFARVLPYDPLLETSEILQDQPLIRSINRALKTGKAYSHKEVFEDCTVNKKSKRK